MDQCVIFHQEPWANGMPDKASHLFWRVIQTGQSYIRHERLLDTVRYHLQGEALKQYSINQDLYKEVERLGAKDMELCMQCGICTASCALSSGVNTFPRKIYRYLQLGLKDKLLESPEPWLCYYCGDCNSDCPRGAEPAETMMATRRWLTTQYDVTGLAKRLYLSKAWELGSLAALALGIALLFVLFHGPIVTDHVSVNTFAPVVWIEIGDLTMAAVLSTFLMINAFRMFRYVMGGSKVSPWLYFTQGKEFILHFLTQKRWNTCSDNNSRWVKHLILVSGYLTMMLLVIVFIRWFQVDDDSWHFTSIFGYYATGVIMFMTAEMLYSRYKKKQEAIHRFSHSTDWLFLILLFMTSLTGILMHSMRLLDWALPTYIIYVIHLAIAVPMLVIEVPFGKWSHLFYRPLAVFLTAVKAKASQASGLTSHALKERVDDLFMACMQCGTCTTVCPANQISAYSPRQVIRLISTDSATVAEVDEKVWDCVTCNTCVEFCPRGIEIVDLTKAIRGKTIESGQEPNYLKQPLSSLKAHGNPWSGLPERRVEWVGTLPVPSFSEECDYCLFTCCTTVYDKSPAKGSQKAGQALIQLLNLAGVSYGTLGTKEQCCGDLADITGEKGMYTELAGYNSELFLKAGVKKLMTTSPHCLNAFKNNYPELKGTVQTEHYVTLLNNLVLNDHLKPERALNLKVTYHDPCYLGRYNGIYEAPRQLLQSIPGIELIEMDSNRERSLCCGGGGSGAFKNQSRQITFGELRVREALKTGADVLATTCPYCIRMLNAAVRKSHAQKKIVVLDVAELLLQSVNQSLDQEKNRCLCESESTFVTVE
jgi:Fe-S oxidoreductase/predicted membrane channel-forming protein YqfA (hemolysin III family)